MTYQLLDVVRAVIDRPDLGIRAGDLGTVLELHGDDAYEVEFCDEQGRTLALLAIRGSDLMPARPVRQLA